MKETNEKPSDFISIVILIVGMLSFLVLLATTLIMGVTNEACDTIGCLNEFIFTTLKAPLGVLTATIAAYSARMLHVRFSQSEKQIRNSIDQNNASNYFMHIKSFEEFCMQLEKKYDVSIDSRQTYKVLFPSNSPLKMSFELETNIDLLIHPIIKSKENLENSSIDSGLLAQLAFESFILSYSILGISAKDKNTCSQVKLSPDMFAHAVGKSRNRIVEGPILKGSFNVPLMDKKWSASENKLALIAVAFAKFGNVDLRDRTAVSSRLSGFVFLDSITENLEGISIVPPSPEGREDHSQDNYIVFQVIP